MYLFFLHTDEETAHVYNRLLLQSKSRLTPLQMKRSSLAIFFQKPYAVVDSYRHELVVVV